MKRKREKKKLPVKTSQKKTERENVKGFDLIHSTSINHIPLDLGPGVLSIIFRSVARKLIVMVKSSLSSSSSSLSSLPLAVSFLLI